MKLEMIQSEVYRARMFYPRMFKLNPKLQAMVQKVICLRYLKGRGIIRTHRKL